MSTPIPPEHLSTRRRRYAGFIANGRTAALIDDRGRVGWLAFPTFAHFPVCASLLDPAHGGCLELGLRLGEAVFWSGDYGAFAQRYLPGSSVLETIWTVAGRTVTILDWLPRGRNLLVRELVLRPADGQLSLLARLRPTAPTPASTTFVVRPDGIYLTDWRVGGRGRLRLQAPGVAATTSYSAADALLLEFALPPADADRRLTLLLSYEPEGDSIPCAIPNRAAHAAEEREWLSRAVDVQLPDGELTAAFQRSLLTLRGLIYEPTGAILAAATASFPSEPGGSHNWDYRYCWVRDGCYTAQALDTVGLHREAARLYDFLLERQGSDGGWPAPLWAIAPGFPVAEEEVPGLYGPAGESPMRIGNAAALQAQHDSPGNVLGGVYRHCLLSGDNGLAERHWPGLARAAEWCCQHWHEPEAGIWERRDRERRWVHGQALCWSALRHGIRLAQRLGKAIPPGWEATAATIARTLPEAAWSAEKGAYLRAYGEPAIYDVSALALLLEGLLPPEEPRLRRTVETLAQALAYGPAFRRDEEDERYPFYLTTLWLIRALQLSGQYERAYAHLRAVLEGATDLALMGEYFDPLTGRQWGNFPQAFSHEELVKTVAGMLWDFDGERLVLFPAIPVAWLVPGSTIVARNIPLGGERGTITLEVAEDALRFTTQGTGRCRLVVPRRYFATGRRVEVNGKVIGESVIRESGNQALP
jgi:hypothetical protein